MKQSKRRNKKRSYSISGIGGEIAATMERVGAHRYMTVFTADASDGEPAFFFNGPPTLQMIAWMNSVENRLLKSVIDSKAEDPDMEFILKAALVKLNKAHGDFFKAIEAYEKGRAKRHINP